jgi:hypothetical protein
MSASYNTLANPPNLMSLYAQMYERDRASDQINRGFALIAANHSSPEMARNIMQSVSGNSDSSSMVGNLMSLYGAQQGMAAQQAMLGQVPAIAAKLNMPEAVVRAEIMAGRGPDLVKSLEPTTTERDIQGKHDIFIKSAIAQGQDANSAEADWQKNHLPFLIDAGGGGDAATRSWQTERIMWNRDHPGEAVPWGTDTPENFALYQQDQKKRQDNIDTAAASFGQYDNGLSDVRTKVTAIQSNPELLKSVLQNPLLVSAVKTGREGGLGNTLSADAQSALAHATPEQKKLVNDILDLSDPGYIKSLQGRSSNITHGDIPAITSALDALGRLGTPPKQYGDMLSSALDAVDNARANNYGATNQLDLIPDDDLRKRVNKAYLPGGAGFVGQGKPMPPDELAAAKKSIADGTPKATVIDLYQRHGYNTKPIG